MRKLIGAVQAAALLGVTRSTLNRWVASGRLVPDVDMDGATGARLYDADAITAYANSLRSGAA